MLILSRKEGESIMIGDSIEVCITRIEQDSVKIGIIAPRELAVFRDEVYRRIRDSNLSALRQGSAALPQIKIPIKPSASS